MFLRYRLLTGSTAVLLLLLLLSIDSVQSQAPEVHQAAALAGYTGLYTFLGSWIAIREVYFLASIISVLIAGSVLLTFLQLPNYFLPVHHNQRSLVDTDELGFQVDRFIEAFQESLESWSDG